MAKIKDLSGLKDALYKMFNSASDNGELIKTPRDYDSGEVENVILLAETIVKVEQELRMQSENGTRTLEKKAGIA